MPGLSGSWTLDLLPSQPQPAPPARACISTRLGEESFLKHINNQIYRKLTKAKPQNIRSKHTLTDTVSCNELGSRRNLQLRNINFLEKQLLAG